MKRILEIGHQKQNPEFIPLAKKIVCMIARANAQSTVDSLVAELSVLNIDKQSDQKPKSQEENKKPQEETTTTTSATTTSMKKPEPKNLILEQLRQSERSSPSPETPSEKLKSESRRSRASSQLPQQQQQLLQQQIQQSQQEDQNTPADDSQDKALKNPFSSAIPSLTPQDKPLSRGQLALILLAELSYEVGNALRVHYHTILQILFLSFDHSSSIVTLHSRILLLNFLHFELNSTTSGNSNSIYV